MDEKIKRWMLIALILVSTVGCDQATKAMARTHLLGDPIHSFMADTFRLQYSENSGAFLNLGAYLPAMARYWIFTLLIGAFLAGALVYLLRKNDTDWPTLTAYSLILAGGIGNLIDRILFNGHVTDFMNIGIGSLRTGIFNVADVAITAGAAILVWSNIKKRSQ
jgi:signal peptidase II